MKFTVVISVLNIDDSLEICIGSVLNSNSDEKFEIENEVILILPNIFPNKDIEKLDCLLDKYRDVSIIKSDNDNLGDLRNNAIKNATGDYIVFINSFEYFDNSTIKNYYNECIENNLDIINVDYKFLVQNTEKKYSIFSRKKCIKNDIFNGSDFYNITTKKEVFCDDLSTYIYKRKFLMDNDLYFYDNFSNDTYLFITKSLINAYRVKYIHDTSLIKNVNEIYGVEYYKKYNNIENEFKRTEELLNLLNESIYLGIINELLRLYYDMINFMDKNINYNVLSGLYNNLQRIHYYNLDKNISEDIRLDIILNNFKLYKSIQFKKTEKLHKKYCDNLYLLNQIMNNNKSKEFMDDDMYYEVYKFLKDYEVYGRFINYEYIEKILFDYRNGKETLVKDINTYIKKLQRDLETCIDPDIELYFDIEDKIAEIINNL